MWKNYFVTLFRNLWRNRVNSLINISGMAVSIACCIFIYVFIRHEKTFDHFHARKDRIYRLVFDEKKPGQTTFNGFVSFPLAPALRSEFPELESVTQVYVYNSAVITVPGPAGERKVFEDRQMTFADEYFFNTFDFKKIVGNNKLLAAPDEVVLTRSMADKFYGKELAGGYASLLGKTLIINKQSYRITAILEDLPRNSNVACHLFLSFRDFERANPALVKDWKNHYSESYAFVTLPAQYTAAQFEAALRRIPAKYLAPEDAAITSFHIQPLTEVHSDEKYGGTYYSTPSILILAFVIMGAIVLITSCINFVNLATVQSLKRAREIGIRKALGSGKSALVLRFMGETFVLVSIAAVIGTVLAQYFLTAFNQYLSFIVELGLSLDTSVFLFLAVLVIAITLLAGYYPANAMASFRPVQALKETIRARHTGFANRFSLRKALVVTQFTVSQVLIIGTIVVATQMKYFRSRDLGYEKKGIYMMEVPENDPQKLAVLRQKLLSHPFVKEVSYNSGPPTSASNGHSELRRPEATRSSAIDVERKFVDAHYLDVFNIQMAAGRKLREADRVTLNDTISNYNVLLNKRAALVLGFPTAEAAIGAHVMVTETQQATVVGVTENFFNVSLQQEVSPCLLFYGTNWVGMAALRIQGDPGQQQLAALEKAWQSVFPDQVYKGMTLDHYIDHKAFYVIEDIMYQGFRIFVVLALVIGCMGLYGLVSFLALQRQKEIGIRKVLGASVRGIVYLFSKEFTILVVLSFVIAAPLGYLAMRAWLQGFANKIDLHAGYFLLSFVASLVVAAGTVGIQAVRAAIANPVRSLKSE